MLTRFIKILTKRQQSLSKIVKATSSILKGYYPIFLDYPVKPIPRYGYGKPPHSKLYEIINKNGIKYRNTLKKFLRFKESFWRISAKETNNIQEPCWINKWIPSFDALALYSFLCINNPKRYFEIGSGHSTRFAKKAILDHNLRTRIISIDPNARIEIDSICDKIIRYRLEEVNPLIFDELEENDILFIDGSHRCFMNSDVTVTFLDILPRLRAGVLVEFHDILLPYDYPPAWKEWYFSEQYLLGAILLAEGKKFDIVLPNYFVSRHPELNHILDPIWRSPKMHEGWSFWGRLGWSF